MKEQMENRIVELARSEGWFRAAGRTTLAEQYRQMRLARLHKYWKEYGYDRAAQLEEAWINAYLEGRKEYKEDCENAEDNG